MVEAETLKRISDSLVKEAGDEAAGRLHQWLSPGGIPYAYPEILEKHLASEHHRLLFDAFRQVLPFGTGGRRGRVGYGPNRMNPSTLAMTVQGHCHYLRKTFPDHKQLSVVVANDVRVFNDIAGVYAFLNDPKHPLLGVSSRSLAKLACEIYAGNGIIAYIAEPLAEQAFLSTPELSFLIDKLSAVGGINLSASHNPPDDNGIKVYDNYGSQPIAPKDQELTDAMQDATAIHALPFKEALANGLIRGLPSELHEDYIQSYVRHYGGIYAPQPNVPIVYTPLCGCGMGTVGDVLKRIGFPLLVPPRQGVDGTFAVIPFKAPNPEVPEATTPAKAFADEKGSGIVLSSDPDADRVGLEVKLADGTWYHFDGNQIAAILCYFLMLDKDGPRRQGLVVETTVTTKLLGKIVEKSPGSIIVDDLLVGFKYVAEVLKTRGQAGKYNRIPRAMDLVLAAEESHGVMVLPTIRDKDATPACLYLAALYQRLHKEGRNLFDYYTAILEELGGYDTVSRSITMSGKEGNSRKERILASLRRSPPQKLGGQSVKKVVDYWDQELCGPFLSKTDELPRNVIQYFTDSFVITIRPSGTEPKLKFYCQLLAASVPTEETGSELLRRAREKADQVARRIYNELLALIDLSLGEATLWLTDIVDLDRKRDFENNTAKQLREGFIAGRWTALDDVLKWLRTETASMTPGADPLPALKMPVSCLCAQWSNEIPRTPLLLALENWAKQL